jgi:hypothetical protein
VTGLVAVQLDALVVEPFSDLIELAITRITGNEYLYLYLTNISKGNWSNGNVI